MPAGAAVCDCAGTKSVVHYSHQDFCDTERLMLTITLLGTAATMPLPDRALTAAATECVGHSLLLSLIHI